MRCRSLQCVLFSLLVLCFSSEPSAQPKKPKPSTPPKKISVEETLRKACEDDDNEKSCYQLGELHSKIPLSETLKKAKKFYLKACVMGHAKGCIRVGQIYQNGKGAIQSCRVAALYYRKACQQGDKSACNMKCKTEAYRLFFFFKWEDPDYETRRCTSIYKATFPQKPYEGDLERFFKKHAPALYTYDNKTHHTDKETLQKMRDRWCERRETATSKMYKRDYFKNPRKNAISLRLDMLSNFPVFGAEYGRWLSKRWELVVLAVNGDRLTQIGLGTLFRVTESRRGSFYVRGALRFFIDPPGTRNDLALSPTLGIGGKIFFSSIWRTWFFSLEALLQFPVDAGGAPFPLVTANLSFGVRL